MNQLIEYFKNNNSLIWVTLAVFVGSAVIILLIVLLRKYILQKRQLKSEIEEASRALAAPFDSVANTVSENNQTADIKQEDTVINKSDAVTESQSSTAEINSETEKTLNETIDNLKDDKDAFIVNSADQSAAQKSDSNDLSRPQKSAYKPENAQSSNQNDQENITDIDDNQQQIDGGETVNEANQPLKSQAAKINDTKKEKAFKTKKYYPPKPAPKADKPTAKYTGKWLIYTENGKYAANLIASNGEVLLRSESYTALSGIKSGIETIKNNINKDNFAISEDKNGNYFFKLYSSSTRLLCISEGYSTKAVCESAIESVKRFAKTAVIEIKKDEQ